MTRVAKAKPARPVTTQYQLVSAAATADYVSQCVRTPGVISVKVENGWVRVTHATGVTLPDRQFNVDLRATLQGLVVMQYKPLSAEQELQHRVNGTLNAIHRMGKFGICAMWPRYFADQKSGVKLNVPVFFGTPPMQFPNHAMFIYGSSPYIEDATGSVAMRVPDLGVAP